MPFGYHISTLQTSDGQEIEIPPSGIVAFVGANNVGKSLALRDINAHISGSVHPNSPARVVVNVRAVKDGTTTELEAWLTEHATRRQVGGPNPDVTFRRTGTGHTSLTTFQNSWSSEGHLGSVAPFFMVNLGPENRTGLVGSVTLWDYLTDDPQLALQLLHANPRLERKLSEAFRSAFDTELTVNRYAGSAIHLQLGQIPPPPDGAPLDRDYLNQIGNLPHLHQQGDGMRSFGGILLTVMTATYPIVLIDEPEAFLHPPQAKLLGRFLAQLVPAGSQVFLATHSSDVLLGLLEVHGVPVTLVRLSRDQDINHSSVLAHEDVQRLWTDSLLKYSNVFSGIFHKGVVVCESDTDATFYAAALDDSLAPSGRFGADFLFTQCGGKDRLHVAIRSLRSLSVPVVAIADIDVLRDVESLRRIVDALGGDWASVEDLQRDVSRDISSRSKNVRVGYAKDQIDRLFANLDGASEITGNIANAVRDIVRSESGWEERKRFGLTGLTGDSLAHVTDLIGRLEAMGLYVVPVGELERWHPPAAGKHGSAWLIEALDAGAQRSEAVRAFVSSAVGSL